VGIEATGPVHWFERLLADLSHQLWIGDSPRFARWKCASRKPLARAAAHILSLLLKEDFPRIWIPTPAERDLRQLLWHRHKLVTLPPCWATSCMRWP